MFSVGVGGDRYIILFGVENEILFEGRVKIRSATSLASVTDALLKQGSK